mmetsp:Transcript_24008/g.36902  ORF Transcript_24008/g.36902 Transcript_24008/m.36902 type:complete len:125 (-) Transcript_24008:585-959(-)
MLNSTQKSGGESVADSNYEDEQFDSISASKSGIIASNKFHSKMMSNRKNSGVPSSSGGGDYSEDEFESITVSQSTKFIPNAKKGTISSDRASGSTLSVPADSKKGGKGKFTNYYSPIKEADEDR